MELAQLLIVWEIVISNNISTSRLVELLIIFKLLNAAKTHWWRSLDAHSSVATYLRSRLSV